MTRSDELRAIAERVTAALPATVSDVVLTGSVSRGVADELSDIELLVVSDDAPDEVPLTDVSRWTPPVDGAWWVGGTYDGAFVELVWWTSAYTDERVHAIADGRIVDWQRLKTAEAIVNGIALRGGRHAEWSSLLARWPDGLTRAIVADAAARWDEPPPRSVLRRGDALALAFQVAEDAENVLRIVFAVNRTWPPGWKRLAERVDPLALKPERLAERIDAAVRALDLDAVRELADEALALAPDQDATRNVRRRLAERL